MRASYRILTSIVLFVAAACPAQPVEHDLLPPGWGSTRDEVVQSRGVPDLTAESFFIYATNVSTAEGNLSADLTLWFQIGGLAFASYAFHTDSAKPEIIRGQFNRLSASLGLLLGDPDSRSSEADSFITEIWLTDDSAVEHTLILEYAEHSLTFTPLPATD